MSTDDTTTRPARRTTAQPGWAAHTAGGLLVIVGLANVVFGVLSLATDLVRLSPAAAGSLLVAGALTAGAGVLVWGGSRLALALSLTVFGILLVLQIGEATGGASLDDGAGPRLAVLVILVASLVIAQLQRPSRRG